MTFLARKTVSAGVILGMIMEELGGDLLGYLVLTGLFPSADMRRGQRWLFVAPGGSCGLLGAPGGCWGLLGAPVGCWVKG